MPHPGQKLVAVQLDVAHRLALDLDLVLLQRDGHRAIVFRLRQRIQRAGLAGIGQFIPHFVARGGVHRAGGGDQLLRAGQVDQFLHQGHRQANHFGQV